LTIWPDASSSTKFAWSLGGGAAAAAAATAAATDGEDVADSPFGDSIGGREKPHDRCHVCGPKASPKDIKTLIIPQVFHFLVTELLSCNVNVCIQT